MSDSLGLSIGVASLVAARVGSASGTRGSVSRLFDHRAPELGVPDENPSPAESGLVLHGLVQEVGNPASFVAPDASTHRREALTVEALDAAARTVGYGAPVAIAVPTHWNQGQVASLREALQAKPSLAPQGVPPALISDATAAISALYVKPGLPSDGVVALCDFGASGTSVTLTDAASNFRHIGETVRYTDFSGDQIDQAILNHLQAAAPDTANTDAVGTGTVGPLTGRLGYCRNAKEQLSAATVAVVPAEMPGFGEDMRLSRTELEDLMSEPLEHFISGVEQILRGNNVPTDRLAAIATVGGGACTPLITQRLSERLQSPVVTTPQPMHSAAIGAAVLALQQSSAGSPAGMETADDAPTGKGGAADAPTGTDAVIAQASVDTGVPTGVDATATTGMDTADSTDMAPAAWAARAGSAAAVESSADGARSATYRALAWSQDPSSGDEPLPYNGEDDDDDDDPGAASTGTAVASEVADEEDAAEPEVLIRLKGSPVLVTVAAAAALVVLAGAVVLGVKLSISNNDLTQTTSNVTTPNKPPATHPAPPPPPPPPPATVIVTETVTGPAWSTIEPTIAPTRPPPVIKTTPPRVMATPTVPTTTPAAPWPVTPRPTTTYTYPSLTTTQPPISQPEIPFYPATDTPTDGQ